MSTNPKIWLSSPHMSGKEREYVQDVFDANWVAPVGPQLLEFENKLRSFAGNHHLAALSSGTAALHLALILLGVKKDDFVICQSLTFSASANPIRYQGAHPIFVDSEADTWNMCPNQLDIAIQQCLNGEVYSPSGKEIKTGGKLPKAIVPVHLYGMPANMKDIKEVADKYGIPIIEDAAEALGATLHDKYCGSFGDFGIFSFNGNKIITTSGGGALISSNEAEIKRARFLATQAREDAPHYEHKVVGYNYRLSNVSAAIGIGQVEVLEERVNQRRSNYAYYLEALGELPGVSFLEEPSGYFANRWLTTILIDPKKSGGIDREQVRLKLEDENIESRPIWKPMHKQPVFQDCGYVGESKIAETIFENGLCLPSGSNLEKTDLNRVAVVFKEIFDK